MAAQTLISIHAPARGATDVNLRGGKRYGNFNPRTREGCDNLEPVARHRASISIHAPARGATAVRFGLSTSTAISIHAPARGATVDFRRDSSSLTNFNPRTREGCDCNFSQKISLFLGLNSQLFSFLLPYLSYIPLLLLNMLSFMHIFRCESPGIFMRTWYSHHLLLQNQCIIH